MLNESGVCSNHLIKNIVPRRSGSIDWGWEVSIWSQK